MARTDDRRAALILLALALAGLGVRMVTGDTVPAGAVGYAPGTGVRPARDSVAAQALRRARPLRRGERIDVDAAPAAELMRLPRIGAGLASRIAADRAARGPFGSLEGLGRVAGIGPATLEAMAPFVRFSGPARAPAGSAGGRIPINRADAAELERLPGIGPALAAAIVANRARHGPYRSADDLTRVRGIGPRTVDRLRGRIIVP